MFRYGNVMDAYFSGGYADVATYLPGLRITHFSLTLKSSLLLKGSSVVFSCSNHFFFDIMEADKLGNIYIKVTVNCFFNVFL
jgi:hypothetical protein